MSYSNRWSVEEDRDTPRRMPECDHGVPLDTMCASCWSTADVNQYPKFDTKEDKEVWNLYLKECPYSHIDVYRVLNIFEVHDHAIGHAVKKLLCAGKRGSKDKRQDIQEAISALERWKEMDEE